MSDKMKKSYTVMNLSFSDGTRENDFLLTEVENTKDTKFKLPTNMNETKFMYTTKYTTIKDNNNKQ